MSSDESELEFEKLHYRTAAPRKAQPEQEIFKAADSKYENLLAGTIILAPPKGKAAAGSTAKLGTGLIGKPSSQIGKTSVFGSGSKTSNYSAPPKLSGSEKTGSFFGASTKDSFFSSSGKTNKSASSFQESSSKTSNLFGTNAKTVNVLDTSPKYSSALGSSAKSYSSPQSSAKPDLLSSTKSSGALGSNDKYSNVLGTSTKYESKPTYGSKTETSSVNTKTYSVLGTTGKPSNSLGSSVKNETKPTFGSNTAASSQVNTKSSAVLGSIGKYSPLSVLGTTGKPSNSLGSPVKNESKSLFGGITDNNSSAKSNSLLGSSGTFSNTSAKNSGMLSSTGLAANVLLSSRANNKDLGSSGKHNPYASQVKNDGMLGSTGKASNMLMPSGKNTSKYDDKSAKHSIPLGNNPNVHDPNKMYPSFISPKEKKPTTRFGIIWLPLKKRNKKKDAVYSGINYDSQNRGPSMYNFMSGDSPDYQSQKKKEEETLLVPDRAKVTSVAVNTGITAASIDMPPDGSGPANPEEKQEFIRRDTEESKEAAGDTNENNKINKDYLENNEDFTNKSPEKKWDNEKQGDKVDSVYLRPPPPHKARSTTSTNDEEDCGIKCLYYTLQCCDCVLM